MKTINEIMMQEAEITLDRKTMKQIGIRYLSEPKPMPLERIMKGYSLDNLPRVYEELEQYRKDMQAKGKWQESAGG